MNTSNPSSILNGESTTSHSDMIKAAAVEKDLSPPDKLLVFFLTYKGKFDQQNNHI